MGEECCPCNQRNVAFFFPKKALAGSPSVRRQSRSVKRTRQGSFHEQLLSGTGRTPDNPGEKRAAAPRLKLGSAPLTRAFLGRLVAPIMRLFNGSLPTYRVPERYWRERADNVTARERIKPPPLPEQICECLLLAYPHSLSNIPHCRLLITPLKRALAPCFLILFSQKSSSVSR